MSTLAFSRLRIGALVLVILASMVACRGSAVEEVPKAGAALPPETGPQAPLLAASAEGYALEILSDAPIGHWPMSGDREGPFGSGTASSLETVRELAVPQMADGAGLSVEMWVAAPKGGVIAAMADGKTALALVHDETLTVIVGTERHNTGISLDEGWHHLAVVIDDVGEISVFVDAVGRFTTQSSPVAIADASWVTGVANIEDCDVSSGWVADLALFDRSLTPDRILSRVHTRRGWLPPTQPGDRLPLEMQTQLGHMYAITSAVFSPNDELLVTSSARTTKLWDVVGRYELATLPATGKLAFNPNGRVVAVVEINEVKLIDVATRETFRRVSLPPSKPDESGVAAWVNAAAFSSDGELLGVARGKTVYLVDVQSQGIVAEAVAGFDAWNLFFDDNGLIAWGDYDSMRDSMEEHPVAGWTVGGESDGQRTLEPLASPSLPDVATRDNPRRRHTVGWSSDGRVRVEAWPNGPFSLVDTEKKGHRVKFAGAPFRPMSVAASPDGRYIAADFFEHHFVIWDLVVGKRVFASHVEFFDEDEFYDQPGADDWSYSPHSIVFARDGKSVWTSGADGALKQWALDGKLLSQTKKSKSRHQFRRALALSPDGTTLSVSRGSPVESGLVDIKSKRLVRSKWTYKGGERHLPVVASAWHPSGRRLAVGVRGVGLLDVEQGTVDSVFEAAGPGEFVEALAYSPDGNSLLVGGRLGIVTLVDTKSLKELRRWDDGEGTITAVAFLPDGERVVTAAASGAIRVRSVDESKAVGDKRYVHPTSSSSLAVLPDGRFVSAGADGTLRLWSPDDDDHVVLAGFSDDEWFASTSDGFFDMPARSRHLLAAVVGTRATSIDQLAITRNRTDILLERLGANQSMLDRTSGAARKRLLDALATMGITPADLKQRAERASALASVYRARYERRVSKAGASGQAGERALLEAQARIVAVSEPDRWNVVNVELELSAPNGLKAYKIFVGGVPLFGARGKPVSGQRVRVVEPVEIISGENLIEVMAVDQSNVESLSDRHRLTHENPRERGSLYFVAFGVSDYAHSSDDLPNLGFAHQDAIDLEAHFRDNLPRSVRHMRSLVYVNDKVTKAAFEEAAEMLSTVRAPDTVVLFVAGHGVRDSDADETYYYLLHETKLEQLSTTALPFSTIEELLYETPARKKLFLLDTCQSGEHHNLAPTTSARGIKGVKARAVRGVKKSSLVASVSPTLQLGPWLSDSDRFSSLDLARRSGAIVFSSSLGHEASLESVAWKNGAFTEAVLEATSRRNGCEVSTNTLRASVPKRVAEMTKDRQHPTIDKDNVGVSFPLFRHCGPPAPRRRGGVPRVVMGTPKFTPPPHEYLLVRCNDDSWKPGAPPVTSKKSKNGTQNAFDGPPAAACAQAGKILLDYHRAYDEARELLTRACDADHSTGCTTLAEVYGWGYGVKKDTRRANELRDKACRLGSKNACE